MITNIHTNPSRRWFTANPYPNLRENIYNKIIHHIHNLKNDQQWGRDELINLTINDILSQEEIIQVQAHKLTNDAVTYLDEIKYAILLNDVKYLHNVICIKTTEKIIKGLHIRMFKNSTNIDQHNPHAYKSPHQSSKIILLKNNLAYIGEHTDNLTPCGHGIFINQNNIKYDGRVEDYTFIANAPIEVTLPNGIIYKLTFGKKTKQKDQFLYKLFNQHINPYKYNTQEIINIIKDAPHGTKVYLKHNEIIAHYTDDEKYVIPIKLSETDLLSHQDIFHQVYNSGMSDDEDKKIFCPTDVNNFLDITDDNFIFPGGIENFKTYLLETHEMKKIISNSANFVDSKKHITLKLSQQYSSLGYFRTKDPKDFMQQVEKFAKNNRILNCKEFAFFTAQLFLKYLRKLDQEIQQKFYDQYEIEAGILDNEAIEDKDNHDHGMLFIVKKTPNRERVCIIDTWLIAKYPHQIFIGTEDNYVKLLKQNADGRFVKNNIIKAHIKPCENNSDWAFTLTTNKFHKITKCRSYEDCIQELNDEYSERPNGLWVILNLKKIECYYVTGKFPNRQAISLNIIDTELLECYLLLNKYARIGRLTHETLKQVVEFPEHAKQKYKKLKIIQTLTGENFNKNTD